MVAAVTIKANGKAEMCYVGETPWHGLGNPIEIGASLEACRTAAGFDWEAYESVVQYQHKNGGIERFNDKKVIYRSDTGEALSTVGSDYRVHQPGEIFEFFRDLTEEQGWHIHTAGTLQGGAKLWVMASNCTDGEAIPGDVVKGNLLLATSLDGTMRTTAAMIATRVVCMNTLRIALKEKGKKATLSHKSEFDAGYLKREIGVAHDTFGTFMETAKRLAETPVALDEAREILRELFGRPTLLKNAETAKYVGTADGSEFAQLLARSVSNVEMPVKEQRSVTRTLELFQGEAMGSDMAKGSRWGLLNAITQHLDWERGRTADARINSAWFGQANNVKQDAMKLLTA